MSEDEKSKLPFYEVILEQISALADQYQYEKLRDADDARYKKFMITYALGLHCGVLSKSILTPEEAARVVARLSDLSNQFVDTAITRLLGATARKIQRS